MKQAPWKAKFNGHLIDSRNLKLDFKNNEQLRKINTWRHAALVYK